MMGTHQTCIVILKWNILLLALRRWPQKYTMGQLEEEPQCQCSYHNREKLELLNSQSTKESTQWIECTHWRWQTTTAYKQLSETWWKLLTSDVEAIMSKADSFSLKNRYVVVSEYDTVHVLDGSRHYNWLEISVYMSLDHLFPWKSDCCQHYRCAWWCAQRMEIRWKRTLLRTMEQML